MIDSQPDLQPLTPDEAEKAYDAAEPVPLTEDRLNEMMQRVKANGMRDYILDDNGEPVPEPNFIKAAIWMGTHDRQLKVTRRLHVAVSTVFLSIDHGWGKGKPVLWETMIFGGPFDEEQQRYTSRKEALEGHELMCARAFCGRGQWRGMAPGIGKERAKSLREARQAKKESRRYALRYLEKVKLGKVEPELVEMNKLAADSKRRMKGRRKKRMRIRQRKRRG